MTREEIRAAVYQLLYDHTDGHGTEAENGFVALIERVRDEAVDATREPAPAEPSAQARELVRRVREAMLCRDNGATAAQVIDRALTDERKAAEDRVIEAAEELLNSERGMWPAELATRLRARLAQDRGNG